ncbi:protein scabrous-like [Hydractinia symbiolongicarpus]|uniref:protein scabrous-like n=1 Tax=Hydractinia symbiolongicarpus TaxID=13093 RepID=UPI00254EAD6E|nr:protein scabrous-like [Hydractinia symbiolongicarpus]
MNISSCIKLSFCIMIYFTVNSTTQHINRMSPLHGFSNIKVGWVSFKKYSQRLFNITSFHQQDVSNVGQCQRLCLLNERCKSFNLLPGLGNFQCQLLNTTFYGNPCKMERHMTGMHYTTSNPCTQIYNLCPDYSQCIPDESLTSYSCQNKTGIEWPHFCPTTGSSTWILLEAAIPAPFCHACDTENIQGSFVILSRKSDQNKENFNRGWQEYKEGFGGDEFYVGNELIHQVTKSHQCELHIHMSGSEGTYKFYYGHFRVESEANSYRIKIGEFHLVEGGNLQDDLSKSNGNTFSTFDYGDSKRFAQQYQRGGWHVSEASLFNGYWRSKTYLQKDKYFTVVIARLKKKV